MKTILILLLLLTSCASTPDQVVEQGDHDFLCHAYENTLEFSEGEYQHVDSFYNACHGGHTAEEICEMWFENAPPTDIHMCTWAKACNNYTNLIDGYGDYC